MAEQPIPGGASAHAPRARAVLLDAMGTLLTFAPPAPLLRVALAERHGVRVGEDAARAAMRAEIAHYRAHLHEGRDAPSLAALRRASAEAMRPALGPAAAELSSAALTDALLAALRFEAYPDAAPALRALRAAGLRLVVVSNWDASLPERLAETGLEALVDDAVASAPFGAAKPEPAIFARALALAGDVPAAAAWHVGDSPEADVAGARAAGLRPVLLARAGRDAAGGGADAAGGAAGGGGTRGDGTRGDGTPVIASLAELPALVAPLVEGGGEYPQRGRR